MTVPFIQTYGLAQTSMGTASDFSAPALIAPYAATVTLVQFVPAQSHASASATASGWRQYSLYNRQGSASSGTGAIVLARSALTSLATTFSGSVGQFGTGLLANVASSLQLNTVSASLTVAAGDVLVWESSHSGTSGVQDVGGVVFVTLSRI